MLGSKTSLLACFALATALATPASAQMPQQQPDSKSFKLGSFDIVALHDAQFVRPNDNTIFGVDRSAEEVADVLRAAGAPTDTITLSVDALLVKQPKRLILIDTGVGGALQQSLLQAGFKPEDVTDVLITHSHPDHMGGLVKGGNLAFPKATIRMSSPEWAFAQKNDQLAEVVKAIDGHVKTFKPGAEVVSGITSVGLKGHTPGHVGYEMVSGKEKLFDIGDTVHSSIISLARPDWPLGFDNDAAVGEETRIKTLKKLATSKELIFAPHFPFPGVGHIQSDGDHFKWVPAS
ncbi:MBL fold metallo-hydrolase [Rhizobium sp. R72]|uniref:MBL fold metallo-hydrolase n=1 Tax=unclassified Rhizobium TaxID=2613769 RepID=UPI000B53289D|nr:MULTISPECIES: MBL fold metallo-hydrolase [unclassified Rhizobium]OWW04460.1 MBL fold metallo-hydrolase [Rhizobium sp. R72]OWW05517.1 MBL fold metallo-hydrolase [Rhizobium sp. R711]